MFYLQELQILHRSILYFVTNDLGIYVLVVANCFISNAFRPMHAFVALYL